MSVFNGSANKVDHMQTCGLDFFKGVGLAVRDTAYFEIPTLILAM